MIIELVVSSSIMFFLYFLGNVLCDKIGWLQAEWRILEDGVRYGYIRGTSFRTSQGYWAVEWRLGGQPLIHAIIPYLFMLISFIGSSTCVFYVARKYYLFNRLKRTVTYLRHPKNFRSTISFSIVAITLILFLAGFVGTRVDPNIIIPAEPSKDYLEVNLKISASCFVEITRFVIVEPIANTLDRNNVSRWFYCVIKTPENAFWNITDIDASTILLNEKLRPSSASFQSESDGKSLLLIAFDKEALMKLFNSFTSEPNTIYVNIRGALKNGDFFAGSTQVKFLHFPIDFMPLTCYLGSLVSNILLRDTNRIC